MAAVESYRFESERTPEENQTPDREDDNDEPERLVNVNWCTCGHCEIREPVRECIFCLEEPESENKFAEDIRLILSYEFCTFLTFQVQSITEASNFPDQA